MPAFSNKEKLAHEFLGNFRLGVSSQKSKEHLT